MINFKHLGKVKPKYRNRVKLKFPYSFDDVFLEKQLRSNSLKFMNAGSGSGNTLNYFICTLLLFTILGSTSSSLYYLISVDYLDTVGDVLTTANAGTTTSQVNYCDLALLPKNLKVFAFLNLLNW
jgi:hypothetical protein